jgi:cell division protein FtsW (lipid II flippase)
VSAITSPSDQPLGGGLAAGQDGAPASQPLPQGRRRTELLMLLFVVGIVMFAYANVGLGLNGKIPAGMVEYGLAFAVLVGAAHVAVRWLAPWADPLLLPLAALLNGLGIVMIYRLQQSGHAGNSGFQISTLSSSSTTMQVMWSALGIAAFVAVLAFIRQPRTLQRYTYTLGAIGLALLAMPALLPSSISEVPGTNAKIQVGLGGFTVQPEEFAKLALAVFFAGYLVAKRDVLALAGRRVLGIDLPRARDLGPVLIAWGASLIVLIFESDIGTSALFFGLFVVMMYVATQRSSWLIIGFLLFVFGSVVTAELFSHVRDRFVIWLHPFSYIDTVVPSSYQLVQGLYGLGYGGVLGRGLGQGAPYLTPLVQSDFIVTAYGEELGLTGLMALLLIYGLIVQRGLRAAVAVRDPFSKLLAGGLSFVVALQVFVIVGGVTRLIPLTGITTPFLSQGGSSLVASWMLIGLLMRISDTARRPAPQPIQDEGMTQVVRAG